MDGDVDKELQPPSGAVARTIGEMLGDLRALELGQVIDIDKLALMAEVANAIEVIDGLRACLCTLEASMLIPTAALAQTLDKAKRKDLYRDAAAQTIQRLAPAILQMTPWETSAGDQGTSIRVRVTVMDGPRLQETMTALKNKHTGHGVGESSPVDLTGGEGNATANDS